MLKFKIKRNPVLIHFNVNAQDELVYNRDVYRLLYESSRVRPLLIWRAVAMTCVPALYKRVLQFAAKFPSRLRREGFIRVFPARLTRLLTDF